MASGGFRRASLTVLVGSVLGFGINLLLTPILSRIYSPEVFGLFSTVIAVGTAMVGLSTLRLEVRAQSEPDDGVAHSLIVLGLLTAVVLSLIATGAAAVAVALGATSAWWLVGPVVLAGSLQLLGTAQLARRAAYRQLGLANMVQGAGTGLAQIGAGLWRATVVSLLLGFLLPRTVWLVAGRAGQRTTSPSIRQTWRQFRRYGATAGTSAGINSVAGQALILLTSAMYGAAHVGALAMAVRVLIAPLGIIGQAAAAASVGEVGRILRTGGEPRPVIRHGVRDLLAVGVLPCLLAMVAGPWLAPRVLGPEWAQVGVLVAWLAPGALLQFAVAPFSQLLNMTRNNRELLQWDITRLILLVLALLVPWLLGMPLWVAIGAYSAAQIVLYVLLLHLTLRSVTGRHRAGHTIRA